MVGSKSLSVVAFTMIAGFSVFVHAEGPDDIAKSLADEAVLLETQASLNEGGINLLLTKDADFNINMMLQAIDDVVLTANARVLENAAQALDQLEKRNMTLAQRLEAEAIRRNILKRDKSGSLRIATNDTLKYSYFFAALFQNLEKDAAMTLINNEEIFDDATWKSLIKWTKNKFPHLAETITLPTPQMIKDVFNFEPSTDVYASGRYHKKPRIYMFCRSERKYPCLMVMKDSQSKLWRNSKGEIWSQPALAYSRHKKHYGQKNGDTPAGVQRIDSVMPNADNQLLYGKFRRLILNFVGEGNNESYTKLLLPPSSHNANWWKQAAVARDIGRGALRIHGTGLRSSSLQPYYPLVPTSGCIAKRENTYGRTTYTDQRELLDEMMKASGLNPTYNNESSLQGLIYLLEIDNRKAAVTMKDLVDLGLF